jgi:hypothetical protein
VNDDLVLFHDEQASDESVRAMHSHSEDLTALRPSHDDFVALSPIPIPRALIRVASLPRPSVAPQEHTDTEFDEFLRIEQEKAKEQSALRFMPLDQH